MENQQPFSDSNKERSLEANEDVLALNSHFTQDETLEQTEEHSLTDTPLSGGKTSNVATETSSHHAFADDGQETKSSLQN